MPSIVMNLADMTRLSQVIRSVREDLEILGRRLQSFQVEGLPYPQNLGPVATAQSAGTQLRGLGSRLEAEAAQLDMRRGIANEARQNLWTSSSMAFGPLGVSGLLGANRVQYMFPRREAVVTLPSPSPSFTVGGYSLNPSALLGIRTGVFTIPASKPSYVGGGVHLDEASVRNAQTSRSVVVLPASRSPQLGGGIILNPGSGSSSTSTILPATSMTIGPSSFVLNPATSASHGPSTLILPPAETRDWSAYTYDDNLAYALRDGDLSIRESTMLTMGVVSQKTSQWRDLLKRAAEGDVRLPASAYPLLVEGITAPIEPWVRYEPPPPHLSPDLDWDSDGVANAYDASVSNPYDA